MRQATLRDMMVTYVTYNMLVREKKDVVQYDDMVFVRDEGRNRYVAVVNGLTHFIGQHEVLIVDSRRSYLISDLEFEKHYEPVGKAAIEVKQQPMRAFTFREIRDNAERDGTRMTFEGVMFEYVPRQQRYEFSCATGGIHRLFLFGEDDVLVMLPGVHFALKEDLFNLIYKRVG